MNAVASIVSARPADAATLPRVVADAYQSLDIARWLVQSPSPWVRIGVLSRHAQIVINHGLSSGTVFTTPDRAGVAVLLPPERDPLTGTADYGRNLSAACGEHTHRFIAFDELVDREHPDRGDGWYLALLAVKPDQQGHGVGRALLEQCHRAAGGVVYTEARSPRSQVMLERFGYRVRREIAVPGGPTVTAMLRPAPSVALTEGGVR